MDQILQEITNSKAPVKVEKDDPKYVVSISSS